MTPHRLALLLGPLVLLAACGSESTGAGERRDAPAAPFGFELAMAGLGEAESKAAEPVSGFAQRQSPLVALNAQALAAKLAQGTTRLIDLRDDDEVADGIIPGAEHIPLGQFDPATLDLSDGREVVLYCRSGNRSAIAGEMLAAATGNVARHLDGGVLAWEASGQPLVKP